MVQKGRKANGAGDLISADAWPAVAYLIAKTRGSTAEDRLRLVPLSHWPGRRWRANGQRHESSRATNGSNRSSSPFSKSFPCEGEWGCWYCMASLASPRRSSARRASASFSSPRTASNSWPRSGHWRLIRSDMRVTGRTVSRRPGSRTAQHWLRACCGSCMRRMHIQSSFRRGWGRHWIWTAGIPAIVRSTSARRCWRVFPLFLATRHCPLQANSGRKSIQRFPPSRRNNPLTTSFIVAYWGA